ncbi:hypothetical protein [Curtobacterium sp. 20TX0008]|uniref:hypothetical protein n=1 Tax=Curtobacterium sp. 20TX0008 TaxID=3022018 RepID=UPI00232FF4CD|nr:hypothetical protein [Curtobacterium sp. 20TX0008]MDB6425862.1 hypothetical protein [Curtobacterium sp. 20TX0008]
MTQLRTAPSEFISVEAVRPGRLTPNDRLIRLADARREALTSTSASRLVRLLEIHADGIVQAVLDSPACDDEAFAAAARVAAGAPMLERAVEAARRVRAVRGRHPASLTAEEAVAAASDRSRASLDLRIIHQRFRRRLTVGMALVGNPNTPEDVVHRLEREGAPMVRRAARRRIDGARTGIDLGAAESARRGGLL